ncbi:galactosyltransferase-related protein [Porphyromonas pogonae]|uniref:galactosyltransferase-related protein n=1 Tax=Porphyromonas pogonae TaxID=867595 RepID=UPI002E7720FD|nr:galactosyltransferase-related protein [Porphyromonas pogonae]
MYTSNIKYISVLIPIRVDSQERLSNLLYVIKHLSFFPYIDEILILEADTHSRLSIPLGKLFRHIFIYDNDPIFHRTKYINQLIVSSKNEICGIWDTDVIIPNIQIQKATKIFKEEECTLVYPYTKGIIFLDSSTSRHLISQQMTQDDLFNYLYLKKQSLIQFSRPSYGGAFFVSKTKYLSIGGENQYFYGWGPEDIERAKRTLILGNRIERVYGNAYHLYHPRGINSISGMDSRGILLEKELLKVCSMSRTALKEYIDHWPWKTKFNLI